jgi:molybdopterin molybdotransferase
MKRPLRPVPAAEARRILAGAGRVVGTEEVPLSAAAGRVLAAALVAPEDVPAFPRSAMDGFAVRSDDVAAASEAAPARLALVGSVEMGARPERAVGPGEAMAIPTGGHMPDGADAVIPLEFVDLTDAGEVAVQAAARSGRNVIPPGEDLRRGAEVVPAGRRLGPGEIAALASLGQTRIAVHRRPRVTVLSSGSELCLPGDTPRPAQVRDVNQSSLAALAASAGCEVSAGAPILPEHPDALEHALREALAGADVVVVSGGSSVGGRDHTAEVFARLGEILFHGLAVRPGRPTVVARAGDALLVGLPGVPTAAMVIFEVFMRPLLQRLGGEARVRRWPISARLASTYTSVAGREDYLRVRLVEQEGTWAEVIPGSSLSGLVAADGLVVVPAEVTVVKEEEVVAVWPLAGR